MSLAKSRRAANAEVDSSVCADSQEWTSHILHCREAVDVYFTQQLEATFVKAVDNLESAAGHVLLLTHFLLGHYSRQAAIVLRAVSQPCACLLLCIYMIAS